MKSETEETLMKKLILVVLCLLLAAPCAFAADHAFGPYEVTLPDGAAMEDTDGVYAIVRGNTRVVALHIDRVPDEDPAAALVRMLPLYDASAVLTGTLSLADGCCGITALSANRLGEGIDQLTCMLLREGELFILAGYDMQGDEQAVTALLNELLRGVTVAGVSIVPAQ